MSKTGFIWCTIALLGTTTLVTGASAEDLRKALISTFSNNPTLNAARAAQRAQNETVNQAVAGRRPTVNATTSLGVQTQRINGVNTPNTDATVGTANLTVTQNVFNGFQTLNNIKSAKAGVRAGLENLRNVEQNVLQLAVSAYSDVFRDRKLVRLQERNVSFSREQLRASQAQAEVGEGTRTDVALSRANLADSLSALAGAKSALRSSEATYLQVVGRQPGRLSTPTTALGQLPSSLKHALRVSMSEHPLIKAAQFNVDAGQFNVKVNEGTLLPTVSLNGSYQRNFQAGSVDTNTDTASVTANVSIPIYLGGTRFSQIRQAKETVNQLRIQVDENRRSIAQNVRATWASLVAARTQINAARTNVSASQTALNGLVEERKLGEATTLDVLNAQSTLINAQVALANAQRDRVVATYAVLAATGRLTADRVRVASATNVVSPKFHYKKVRDKWVGLRTISGN